MQPILLIDTNYLCHRAYHAMGQLAYGEMGTGAVFGVLRDVVALQDTFKTDRCVFAFDYGGRGHRGVLLPTYKSSRRERHANDTDEEKANLEDFRKQVKRLRKVYLRQAGFRNVFAAKGFEADDIIAKLASTIPCDEEVVIVASDHDLYQCLRKNVWVYNPHKRKGYAFDQFRAEWGIDPAQWADVKAIAGCSTDDVPGVPGVGEITAAKWVRGELKPGTKAYEKISNGLSIINRNMRLVRLPFDGTPEFELRKDQVTEEKWQELADSLGMRSLRGTMPRAIPRKKKGRKRGATGFGFGR